jgi:hypothetical protein
MALRAHGIARWPEVSAVGVVTVRARHARGVHLALQERPVLVDLVLDLAVGVVQGGVEERHAIVLSQRLAGEVVVEDLRAAGVASAAGLDLGARRGRRRALGDRRPGPERPLAARRVAELDDQPAQRVVTRVTALRVLRPLDVPRSRAVSRTSEPGLGRLHVQAWRDRARRTFAVLPCPPAPGLLSSDAVMAYRENRSMERSLDRLAHRVVVDDLVAGALVDRLGLTSGREVVRRG